MINDFSTEYAGRSDKELLQLTSDRASLTGEAAAALDAELSRRNLTKSDQLEHERFLQHSEQRESWRRHKVFGGRPDRESWGNKFVVLFCSGLVMALIALAYRALPSEYHLSPDWQEAAVYVMFATVSVAVASNSLWRKISFWISLLISSTAHFLLVHAWIIQRGTLSGAGRRGDGKLAVLLGAVLFLLVYGCAWLLRRKFYGEEATDEQLT